MLYQVFENVTRPVRADERERESCLWNIESESLACGIILSQGPLEGFFVFFLLVLEGILEPINKGF